jgi:hypothetical protein
MLSVDGRLSVDGWGLFIALTTKVVVGRLSVDGRTRQSGAPVMSPNR